MKREILKDHEAKILFNECKDYPELIGGLELYEARKLLAIAERGFSKYQSTIVKEMNNPYWLEFEYPDEYLPDRCFQYHLERTDHGDPMKYYRMKERLKTRISQIKTGEIKKSKNVSSDDEGKTPWKRLSNDIQNRITSFLSGKRKRNKPIYRILLSCFELNRDHIQYGDAQAVIDLAKKQDTYVNADHKPGIKPQRDLIKNYMNRYNKC